MWQPNNNNPSFPSLPQQQVPPYPQGNTSPYPQGNTAPYPGFQQGNPIPYPNTTQQAPLYPPTNPTSFPGYPPANTTPYPNPTAQQQPPFYPQGNQPPYPGFQQASPTAYPPNPSPYPNQTQPAPIYPPASANQFSGYPPTNPSYPAAPDQHSFGQPQYPPSAQHPPSGLGYPPIPQQHTSAPQYSPAPSSYTQAQAPSSAPVYTSQPTSHAPTMQHYQEIPTIRAANQDPLADAQILRKAMKGFGTDEAAIINVLTKRTNAERQKISQAFKQSFGKDLIKDLKSELGGRLEEVVLALMTPLFDYMAQTLHKAMAGVGTKEKVLVDVLCTATNQEIQYINASYTRLFGRTIEKDLAGDTSGHFRRLLVSMNTGGRFEGTNADPGIALQDAQNLQKAGVKKWGTDESAFNAVLATRSWPQLRLMFHEYEKLTGHSFEKAVQGEFSGDVEQGMLAVVKCAKNRAAYFAERLHESIAGFGTKDDDLIFIIVTRSEIDLESIKQEYQRMYNKSLAADVSGDTSGDYKKILLALIA